MPGLCLTHAQAQRLWGLNAQTCAWALAALTGEHRIDLRHVGDGYFPAESAAAFADFGGLVALDRDLQMRRHRQGSSPTDRQIIP